MTTSRVVATVETESPPRLPLKFESAPIQTPNQLIFRENHATKTKKARMESGAEIAAAR